MFNRLLTLRALAGFAAALAGCNTVEGMGKDVKAGGTKIQEEAVEHRKY
jgi:predicted small secreted protein